MERVSGDGFFSYRREVGRKESRRSERTGRVRSFLRELEPSDEVSAPITVGEDDSDSTAALLDAVFETGDRLKRHQDGASLTAYRDAVRRFLGAVVQRGLGVEERTSGSTIMRRKRYTVVRVVDAKLEELAAGMAATQREQLDLLARVDEINGLLVDLSH